MTVRESLPDPSAGSRAGSFFGLLIPSLRDIRLREPLAPPLLAGWIVSAAAALALRPLAVAQSSSEDPAPAIVFWSVVLFAPVAALVKAGLLAAATWAALAFGSVEARFRPLLSIFLYGEALMALRGVVGAIYLHWTMLRQSPEEVPEMTLGLSALASQDSPALVAALQSLSLPHMAWAAFLALALRETLAMPLRRSMALAGGIWTAVVATAALRNYLAF